MRRVLGGLAGFILAGFGAAVIGVALPEILPISQAEGAYMMSVAFFWVPLAALVGAILGAVLAGPRR